MLKERMLEYIREKELIRPGDHVLAACSGGADSVCMLILLAELRDELRFRLSAVHVHHGLRGEAADRDASFVETLAEKLGIPCSIRHVDVPAFREERRLSVEEAARILRYREVRKAMRELGANRAAAAHHREDQAETVLFNLIRGSGLRGLSGMRPVNGALIRPMLPFTRGEIVEELEKRGQNWCEDETNESDAYTRNVIRNQIFPAIAKVREDAAGRIAETAELLAETEDYLTGEAEAWCAENAREDRPGEIRIPADAFRRLHPVMRREVILFALRKLEFSLKDRTKQNIVDMASMAERPTGKRYILHGEGELAREYGDLVLRRSEAPEETLRYSMSARVFPRPADEPIPPGNWENLRDFAGKQCTKWFDYGKINQMPVLRTRQEGDRFSTRAGTHKKLKEYLIDEKVPRELRDRLMLAAADSEVLWVIGMRMNEEYKVTEETGTILEITVTGVNDEREDQYIDF